MTRLAPAVPLVPLQEGILYHCEAEPASHLYEEQVVLEIVGSLDFERFRSAWEHAVTRFDALRARLIDAGESMMEIVPEAPIECRQYEWRQLGVTPAAALAAYLEADRVRGFALRRAPLARVAVIVGDERHRWLVFSHHHLVVDARSVAIVLADVFHRYATGRHRFDGDPGAGSSFSDYAGWIRRHHPDGADGYWRTALAGAEVGAMPGESPTALTARGEYVFALDADTTAALSRWLANQEASLAAALGAAWSIVASRYTGSRHVIYGATVDARPPAYPGIDDLVGALVTTLPIRAHLDELAPATALLRELERHLRAVAARATTSPTSVLELAALPPGMPLTDCAVYVQDNPVARIDGNALARAGLEVAFTQWRGQSHHSLMFIALPTDSLSLRITYDRARFENRAITQLADHLCTALGWLARSSELPLRGFDMLSSEHAERLRGLGTGAATATRPGCVHDRIAHQAERRPDAIAIDGDGGRLTFAELRREVERTAGQLAHLGVGADSVVGIFCHRSPEAIVAILAALEVGAAYLPLDPDHPADYRAGLVTDSRAAVIVASRSLVDAAPPGVPAIPAGPAGADLPGAAFARGDRSANAAYVLYTSGSTGRPKGVVVDHSALRNHMDWMLDRYPLSADDAVLQRTSFGFDASVWEVFAPLMSGARLVLADPDASLDPHRLVGDVIRHRVTVLQVVPTLLEALVREPELARCRSLRRLFSGGEALSPELVDAVRSTLELECINLYGPTEATIEATWYEVGRGSSRTIPIGRPISNVLVRVLDDELRLVPEFGQGELHVGGACLARGYHGNPRLTAAAFIPDPYASVPGQRLYRTGDLVRWNGSGQLEYLGRRDQQVKVRGARIETGEVETALRAHPAVVAACADVRRTPVGEKQLVGYVEVTGVVASDDIRGFLTGRVPPHLIPSRIVAVDAMPLLSSGKVDRRALPDPDWGTALRRGGSPPATGLEKAVAEIWSAVLGTSIDDTSLHFFVDLGGSSLSAMRALARTRAQLAVELSVRDLFDRPTVATLAAEIARRARTDHVEPFELRRAAHQPDTPLSRAQARMWFLHQLDPQQSGYNIPLARRLRGRLDVALLERALDALGRRHQALRSVFLARDGVPHRALGPGPGLPSAVDDLGDLPAAERELELARLALGELQAPFDLATGPLARVRIVRLAPDDHALLITMHHIISDGWSCEVLWRDLCSLYARLLRGEPAELPEPPIEYADYVMWERDQIAGNRLERQLAYWTERLAGAPADTDLPLRRPRPTAPITRAAVVTLELSAGSTRELAAVSRAHAATPFIALVAAFRALLWRYTGQSDICIGTPVANRSRSELADVVGLFVNTIVLRTPIRPADTFAALLARERETVHGSIAHQEMPFELVVDALGGERDMSKTPLFQVFFVHEETSNLGATLGPVVAEPIAVPAQSAKFELTVRTQEVDGKLVVSFVYQEELFEEPIIAQLAEHYMRYLRELIAHPSSPIVRIPLLRGHEQTEMLARSSPPPVAGGPRSCLHEQFESQVRRVPDAPAVACGETVWSYHELNRRANLLAAHLLELDVRADDRVGLLMSRSAEAIAGMLGIMKAGAAYLPLDPGHPPDRLGRLIRDAGAQVVVTRVEHAGACSSGVREVIADELWTRAGSAGAPDPAVPVRPQNLIYVIYTSGSTGTPKGVAVEHRQVVSYLVGLRQRLGLEPGWSYATVSTLGADLGNTSIFAALSGGGCLHVLAEHLSLDPAAMASYMALNEIDCLKIVPSHFLALANEVDSRRLLPRRRLIMGGEAASVVSVVELQNRAGCRIANHYGPTETTVGVAAGEIPPPFLLSRRSSVPLGQPMAGTRILCLDGELNLLPPGAHGELYVGGEQVTRGYIGRAAVTAERFVPDPFGSHGDRLYRTGDLGRYRCDGTLELLGRLDHQVKVRGFRIELGEIEVALARIPGVRAAVVAARAAGNGDRRLVAYVEVGATTAEQLRAQLAETLPGYMIPAAFVTLDRLPRSSNGKIDRQMLPEPDWAAAMVADDVERFAAPEGATENDLAGIWLRLLGLHRVSRSSDFFLLGGHSLLAVRLVAEIERRFHVKLQLIEVFRHSRLCDLAGEVDRRSRDVGVERGVESALPASGDGSGGRAIGPQRVIWDAWNLDPENQLIVMHRLRYIDGPLDRDVFQRALNEVVRRHSALRTTYAMVGSELHSIVQDRSPEIPVVYDDLSECTATEQEYRAQQLAFALRSTPFDLERGPIVRAALFRLGNDRFGLSMAFHHIGFDADSTSPFFDDLFRVYTVLARAASAGEPESLGPLPPQYSEFVAQWNRHARSTDGQRELDYWRQHLRAAPPPEIPGCATASARLGWRGHGSGRLFAAKIVSATLGPPDRATLASISRGQGASGYSAMLAGLIAYLCSRTGQTDLAVWSTLAQRHQPGREAIVGLLGNPLVMRFDAAGDPSYAELVARVRDTVFSAYAHGGVAMLEHAPPDIRRINFNYLGSPAAVETRFGRDGELRATHGGSPPNWSRCRTPFDLLLWLTEVRGGVELVLLYNAELLEPDAAQRLVNEYVGALAQLAAAPNEPIGRVLARLA